MSGTGFTNIDMSAISQMSKLATIYFSSLNLSGNIPVSLFSLPALVALCLTLSDNNFTGEIPAEAKNKTSLYHLNLSRNQLTGEIPGEIGNMTNLQGLILSNNQLTGAIPSSINQTYLRWLDLSNNQFTDLPDLSGLSDLQGLWIYGNRFSFEDIEPNIGLPASYYYYSPQELNIGDPLTVTLEEGKVMSVGPGGNNNNYQWFKDRGSNLFTHSEPVYSAKRHRSFLRQLYLPSDQHRGNRSYLIFISHRCICKRSGICKRFPRSGSFL